MSSNPWSRPTFNLNLSAWRGIRRRNPEPIDPRLEVRFWLTAAMFSMLGRMQARRYRHLFDRIELRPPIFIVGHWRSGTTLLHELLALDPSLTAPSTYACFNPHHFLLTRHRTLSARQLVRPTGDMTVSSSSPQEEEFALLCMGAVSPYEAFLFPRALHHLEALCDPAFYGPAQQLRWERAITWMLRATALVQGTDKHIVLKSPTNSFRIGKLSALFGDAKFIKVVRDPCAVFASTRELWRSMWERYALAAPLPDEVLIERVLETGLALKRRLEDGLRTISRDRIATVRFEDLVADPRKSLERLCEELNIGDPPTIQARVDTYMRTNPPPPPLSTEQWVPMVQTRWREIFDDWGYLMRQ